MSGECVLKRLRLDGPQLQFPRSDQELLGRSQIGQTSWFVGSDLETILQTLCTGRKAPRDDATILSGCVENIRTATADGSDWSGMSISFEESINLRKNVEIMNGSEDSAKMFRTYLPSCIRIQTHFSFTRSQRNKQRLFHSIDGLP